MKKYGTGEVTDVEKTDAAKTATKESFTEDDAEALAEENAEADG